MEKIEKMGDINKISSQTIFNTVLNVFRKDVFSIYTATIFYFIGKLATSVFINLLI